MRYPSGNEYNGEWMDSKQHGEGILKESDLLFRVNYDQGNLITKVKLNAPPSK